MAHWAATAEGLVHFIDGRMSVYRDAAGLPAAPIFRVMQDASGTMFAGTERGVYRMQGERFVAQSPLLPEDGVPSLAKDNSGNLWVGTVNNGLVRLGASGADRLDLPALQHDAGFEAFLDVVVESGAAVLGDRGHGLGVVRPEAGGFGRARLGQWAA